MTTRRTFLKLSGASLLTAAMPANAESPAQLARRAIRGSDETLAVIALGNSNAFRTADLEVSTNLLSLFFGHGGNYVDAGGSSSPFVGGIADSMGKRDQVFVGNYIDPSDFDSMKLAAEEIAAAQGKSMLDLVHTREIGDFAANHSSYARLKEEGLARYVGVARTGDAEMQESIAALVEANLVDFIQVNYSILEQNAGERLLPLALDKGVNVAISRPFINGRYFGLVQGHELPEWAAEFDCETWAQYSLKFILSHPAVNCVLTETANPKHAKDNIGAGFGRLPDAAMRKRMADHLQKLV